MCPENNKQVNTYEAHNPTVVFLQGIGEICWGFWRCERFVDAAAFDKFLLFFSFLLDWVVLFCAQLFGFETEVVVVVVVRMFLCFNVKELQNLLPWRAVRETGGKKQGSIKLVRVLKNELPISPNPPTSSLRRLQPCKLCVFIVKDTTCMRFRVWYGFQAFGIFLGGELMVLLRFFSCAGFREAVFDPLFGSRWNWQPALIFVHLF